MATALCQGTIAMGLIIALLGCVGLFSPPDFVTVVGSMQTAPKIYVAAMVRVGTGALLFFAAPYSRMPRTLRVLGAVIFVGGAITPFAGTWIAAVVLDAWTSQGPDHVRAWGVFALVLGGFIAWCGFPRRAQE